MLYYIMRDQCIQRFVPDEDEPGLGLLHNARPPVAATFFETRHSAEVAVEQTQTWLAARNKPKAKFVIASAEGLETEQQLGLDDVRDHEEDS